MSIQVIRHKHIVVLSLVNQNTVQFSVNIIMYVFSSKTLKNFFKS